MRKLEKILLALTVFTVMFNVVTPAAAEENTEEVIEETVIEEETPEVEEEPVIEEEVIVTEEPVEEPVEEVIEEPVEETVEEVVEEPVEEEVELAEAPVGLVKFGPDETTYMVGTTFSCAIQKIEGFDDYDFNKVTYTSENIYKNGLTPVDYLFAEVDAKGNVKANKCVTNFSQGRNEAKITAHVPHISGKDSNGNNLYDGEITFDKVITVTSPFVGSTAITLPTYSTTTLTLTWPAALNATGYEIVYARNEDFTLDKRVLTVGNVTTAKLTKLITDKRWYVKMRAFASINGKRYYSSYWTSIRSILVQNPVKNRMNEQLKKALEKNPKYNKTYIITIDTTNNYLGIYKKKKKGVYELKYMWRCTCGAKETPTHVGTFKVKRKKVYFTNEKSHCWYATSFTGGQYTHSVLYRINNPYKIYDGRLGKNLSHGCVRLQIDNAEWIYKNVAIGSIVRSYTTKVYDTK